jgi:hypothetical protein
MAKLSCRSPEGEEQSWKLVPHRATRIGRDPSNDIVIRDAKVSRSHAEIIFEKGFFVIHDLASANGTFVGGKRVRIAPLTEGADLKVGNTHLRFSEEVETPTGTVEGPVPSQADDDGLGPTEPPGELSALPGADSLATPPYVDFGTNPGVLVASPPAAQAAADPTTRVTDDQFAVDPMLFANERPTDPVVWQEVSRSRTAESKPVADPPRTSADPFRQRTYLIEIAPPGEVSSVRSEKGEALFWFKRTASVVGMVAGVLAAMVLISGAAAAVFLALESRFLPAAGAAALTVAFSALMLALVPRRFVVLYRNEALTGKVLSVLQESRFSFPSVRFSARGEDGATIAYFERNSLRGLGFAGSRWWILDHASSAAIGYATESAGAAWQRKLFGFLVAPRANYTVTVGVRPSGTIQQRREPNGLAVDMGGDANFTLDRRIALALGLLISLTAR